MTDINNFDAISQPVGPEYNTGMSNSMHPQLPSDMNSVSPEWSSGSIADGLHPERWPPWLRPLLRYEISAGIRTDHLGKNTGERASWNDSKTEFLLQKLQCFPRAQTGGWSGVTWKKVDQAMKEKFPNSDLKIEQLKQKVKDTRKLYKDVEKILERPGFQWDDKNCMLDASNDCWLKLKEENIMSESKLLGFRTKIIPYYAALAALHKGQAELETKFAKMQIGAREDTGHQACANFDGTSVNLSSPKADEMEPPLSPVFWESFFADNPPNEYDINRRTLPSIPPSSPFNPQNNNNNNPINPYFHAGTSGPSNFQPSSDSSEGWTNKFNISKNIWCLFEPLSSPPSGVSSLNDCENQSHSLSLERDPVRKIRGKPNGKKKGAAKFDYSMERCIKLFHTLQGFEISDIEPTVEIFRDKLNRKAFIAMETSHKAFWLRSKLNKGNKGGQLTKTII